MARKSEHQEELMPLRGKPVEDEKSGDLLPLSLARPCDSLQVVNTVGGRGLRAKVAALGLTPGAEVKVLCNFGGPVVAEVKGCRLSLGRGMAEKILVRKKAEADSCPCPEQPDCPEKNECRRK